jgi:hypothetical protein
LPKGRTQEVVREDRGRPIGLERERGPVDRSAPSPGQVFGRVAETRQAGDEEAAAFGRRLLGPHRVRGSRGVGTLQLDEPAACEAERIEDDHRLAPVGGARPDRRYDLCERSRPLGLTRRQRDGELRNLLLLIRIERRA